GRRFVDVDAAAETVTANDSDAACDLVVSDIRIRDGQESGQAILVGAEDATALGHATDATGAAVATRESVVGHGTADDGERSAVVIDTTDGGVAADATGAAVDAGGFVVGDGYVRVGPAGAKITKD